MEMTDSCTQQQDGDGDEPTSDDSVSLLCDLRPWQSSRGAQDMEVDELKSQFGNEKEVVTEMNALKAPVSGICSYAQSAAGCAHSTSGDCELQTTKASVCRSTLLLI